MDKKGVSIIVAYSILVVIAIGISITVYSFLKLYLPSEKETCPEGISVVINKTICENGRLQISLKNRGLFNISAVYIRMSPQGRETRQQVNTGTNIFLNLAPGETTSLLSYDVSSIVTSDGEYIIEIQPAITNKNKIIVCEEAVIDETIHCT